MAACNFKAPNGEASILYPQLENLLGEEKATQIYFQTFSDSIRPLWEKDFGISSEPEQNTADIEFILKQNPDLLEIGTAAQYALYIETLFPESKVKDIVYHNTPNKFEKFDLSFIGTTSAKQIGERSEDSELGFFFTSDPEAYEDSVLAGYKMPVRLNFKNPFNGGLNYNNLLLPYSKTKETGIEEGTREYFRLLREYLIEEGYDGIEFGKVFLDEEDGGYMHPIGEYIAFTPDQIHILGSAKDKKQFEQFVANQQEIPRNGEPSLEWIVENFKLVQAQPEPSIFEMEPNTYEKFQTLMFAPVRDSNKNLTGEYFTALEQQAAVESLTYIAATFFLRAAETGQPMGLRAAFLQGKNSLEGKLKLLNIRAAGGETANAATNRLTPEQAQIEANKLEQLLNSYWDIASFTRKKLAFYGFKVSKKKADELFSMQKQEEDYEDFDERPLSITEESREANDGSQQEDIEGDVARGRQDWHDVAMQLDPADTASARLKLFMASIPNADYAVDIPKPANITFTDQTLRTNIRAGLKTMTVRTPEQAKHIGLSPGESGIFKIEKKEYRLTYLRQASTTDIDPNSEVNQDSNGPLATFNEENIEPSTSAILYSIQEYIPKIELTSLRNYFGTFSLQDFSKIFQKVLETASATDTPSYDVYKAALQASEDVNLQMVAKELDKQSEQLKNEFVVVMNKQYQEQLTVMITEREDNAGKKFVQTRTIESSRSSADRQIKNMWNENFKNSPIVKTTETGTKVLDQTLVAPMVKKIKEIRENPVRYTRQELVDFAQEILTASGITMPHASLLDMLNPKIMTKLSRKTDFAKPFEMQFSLNMNDKPAGIFSALVMRLAGVTQIDTDQLESGVLDGESDERFVIKQNPIDGNPTAINILMKFYKRHVDTFTVANGKNTENKTVYFYGLPTYEAEAVQDLKNPIELAKLENTVFAKRSRLLQELKKVEVRNAIQLVYFDGLKNTQNESGERRSNMSDREQSINTVALFQNKGKEVVHFVDMAKSDKTTTPVIMNVPKIPFGTINTTVTGTILPEWSTQAITAMENIFLSEFERIIAADKEYNNKQYDQGKKLFYLLPIFNWDNLQALKDSRAITKEEVQSIWLSKGKINPSSAEATKTARRILAGRTATKNPNDSMKDGIMGRLVQITRDEWNRKGVIDPVTFTRFFDRSYETRLAKKLGIFFTKDGVPYKGKTLLSDAQFHEVITFAAAMDYSLNTFVTNIDMTQLVIGDPAQNFKGKSGMSETEAVKATLIEFSKRGAKDLAPGMKPAFEEGEKYKTITIKDYESSSEEVKELLSVYGEGDINATDAQEFTTVREHLDVMFKLGRIPEKIYNEMIAVIDVGLARPDKYYSFEDNPVHKRIVMQIMKPVYVGKRFEQDAMFIDYIKSSSMPLYPPFTAGKGLDSFRVLMEGEAGGVGHIARANFVSAKKMGQPAQPLKAIDNAGNFIQLDRNNPEVLQAIQTLDRKGFRIQQEVPVDETKSEINVVSQANKLITYGLENITDFRLSNGESLATTSEEITQIKEKAKEGMIQYGLNKLFKELNIQTDSMGNVLPLQDFSAIYDKLLQMMDDDGMSVNSLLSLSSREENGSLSIPLDFNNNLNSIETRLLSLIKKAVKVKVPGKSFVQATSVGIKRMVKGTETLTQTEKDGIVWDVNWNTSKELGMLSTNVDGKTVVTAQVLIPMFYVTPSGKQYDMRRFTTVDENGKKTINTETLPDELRELIGFRIPNQGHNSMLPMQIVGFLPQNMGDAIIVPKEITKQMGSDFDVDKLYVYRRPFKEVNGGLQVDADGLAKHHNDYFNVFWTILTHPDMVETVLNPLDKPDLKNETKGLSTIGVNYNFYFHTEMQLNYFLSQKEAKKMVGRSSLFVTQLATLADKEGIRLGNTAWQDGKPVEVGYTIDLYNEKGELMQLQNISGQATAEYWENDDAVGDPIPRTKMDNLTTIQSAVLDHAKDPIADKLNLTQSTFPAAGALCMLHDNNGKAANLKFTARLLRQEILMEYSSMIARLGDSFGSKAGDPHIEVVNKLRDKYMKLLEGGKEEDIVEFKISPQSLKALLETKTRDTAYYNAQLQILSVFDKLTWIGRKLTKAQLTFNQDVNGPGKSMLTVQKKFSDLEEVFRPHTILNLGNVAGILETSQEGIKLVPTTEIGYTFNAANETAMRMFGRMLPYWKLSETVSTLQSFLGKRQLSEEQLKRVRDGYRSYSYSKIFENPAEIKHSLLFGDSSLAKRVLAYQATKDGQENYFIQRLLPTTEPNTADLLQFQASILAEEADRAAINGWLSLLSSMNEAERDLGRDLVQYTYLMGGNQTNNNFVRLIPTPYLLSSGISGRLRQISESPINPSLLAEQVLQHSPWFTTQLNDKQVAGAPESFTVNLEDAGDGEEQIPIFIKDARGKSTVLPYVSKKATGTDGKAKWFLYKLQADTYTEVHYQRIDTLGFGKGMSEYYYNTGKTTRSLNISNRAQKEYTEIVDSPAADDTIPFSSRETITLNSPIPYGINPQGIHERAEVIGWMKKMANDQEIPRYLRILSDKLQNVIGYDRLFVGKPLTVEFTSKVRGAQFINAENKIYLNDQSQKLVFAENLVHEGLHSVTVNSIHSLLQMPDLRSKMPDVAKSLDRLEALRQQAENAFRNQGPDFADKLDYLKKRRQIPKNVPVNERNDWFVAYGMINPYEFITATLTIPEFQEWANQIDVEDRALIEKLFEWIKDFIVAIGESIGMDVREESLLYEAINHSLYLARINEPVVTTPVPRLTGPDILNSERTTPQTDTYKYFGAWYNIFKNTEGAIIRVTNKQGNPVSPASQKNIVDCYLANPNTDPQNGKAFRNEEVALTQQEESLANPDSLDRYELLPGVQANVQQRAAIDSIEGFLQKPIGINNLQNSYVLSGAAGTGKTTVLGKVFKVAGTDLSTALFMGPTHTAVRQLQKSLGEEVKGLTLQAALGMRKKYKGTEGAEEAVFEIIPDEELREARPISLPMLLVIDEASMIDDAMMKAIYEYKRPDAKVIFTGDYAQLEPVGHSYEALPFRSLMGKEGHSSILIQNMRSGKQDIMRVLDAQRGVIDDMIRKKPISQIMGTPYPARRNSENVKWTTPQEALLPLIESYKRMGNDLQSTIMVAYRNNTVNATNQLIRKLLFGDNLPYIVPGDLMMVNAPFYIQQHTSPADTKKLKDAKVELITTGDRLKVVDVKTATKEFTVSWLTSRGQESFIFPNVEVHTITIDLGSLYDGLQVAVDFIPDNVKQDLLKIQYNALTKQAVFSDGRSVPYWKFVNIRSALDGTLSAKHGYCTTSHKAQGAGFDTVFVAEKDILDTTAASQKNRAKSLYTALSRVRNTLYIINSANPQSVHSPDPTQSIRDAVTLGEEQLQVATEKTAKEIVNYANQMDGIQASYRENPNQPYYDVELVLGSPRAATTSGTEGVVPELEGQLRNLYDLREKATSKEERARLSLLISDLNAQLDDAVLFQDRDKLADFGENQLSWVEGILESQAPETKYINQAIRVAKLWKDVTSMLYGTDPDTTPYKRYVDLTGRANEALRKLEGLAQKTYLIEARGALAQTDLILTELPLIATTAGGLTLDASRLSSKFGQKQAEYLQNANRNTIERITRLSKKVEELDRLLAAYAKEKGVTQAKAYEDFLQLSEENDKAWGLVREYSQAYWNVFSDAEAARNRMMEAAATFEAAGNKVQAGRLRSKAWSEYRKTIQKNVIQVDTTIMFDDKTGELKKGANQDKHFAELVRETGSESLAQRLVDKAQDKFKDYIEDRRAVNDKLATDVQAGIITQTKAATELVTWINENSPNVYFKKMRGENIGKVNNQGWKFVTQAPRLSVDNGALYDQKFRDIWKDGYGEPTTNAQKIYVTLNNMMKEFKDNLPPHVKWNLQANFLPIITQEMIGSMTFNWETAKQMPEKFLTSLTATDWDSNNRNKEIPIRYIGEVRQPGQLGAITADQLVKDLPLLMMKFGAMSYHYNEFSGVKDIVELGNKIIESEVLKSEGITDQSRTTVEMKSGIKALQKTLTYTQDVLMYQNRKQLEGNTGIKIYSANAIENIKISKTVRELNAEIYDVGEQISTGEIDQLEGAKKIAELEAEKTKYTGRTVYGSKLGDFLIRIQQAKSLAFNPFSALANTSFGIISIYIHGAGGIDFNNKQATEAFGIMLNSTGKYFTAGRWETPTAEKIMNIMDRFGVLGDVTSADFGEAPEHTLKHRMPTWKKMADPFQWMRSGDYFVKGQILVAMMLNKKVTVEIEGKPTEINLFEAFDTDGNWKYGDNPQWFSETVSEQEEYMKFRNQAIQVTKKIMGNQDPSSPLYAKKYILGRLLGQFRLSWMAEGIASRFESESPDIQLGRKVKGRYITYKELGIGGSLLTLLNQYMSLFNKSTDPFDMRKSDGSRMEEVDIENMKKNFAELNAGLLLYAAFWMMAAALGDDDEDQWMQVVANMFYRNYQDVIFYVSPSIAETVTRSTIPALGVIRDVSGAVTATTKYLTKDDYEFQKMLLKWTKAGLPVPAAANVNKFNYMMNHDLSDLSKSY